MAKGKSPTAAFLTDFVLGGVHGAVVKTVSAPISRIKAVLQTQDAHPKIRSGELLRYKGILDCGARLCEEQGMLHLWDGCLISCVLYFPTQAMNLAQKDRLKRLFPKYSPKTQFPRFFMTNLVTGGLAAASSMCVVYPLSYVRSRLVLEIGPGKKTFTGVWDCIYRTATGPGGFLALYDGFGISVAGILCYRALQLSCFDAIVGLNPWKGDKGFLGTLSTFVAAQIAIQFGAAATYPFDTVRARLQMQSEKPAEEQHYKGTLDCIRKIAEEEGLASGLYKGFLANLVLSVGGSLIGVFYGSAKKRLGL